LTLHGATVSSGPWPSHYRGFAITLKDTHTHTQYDSSGRGIVPPQRPLPDSTKH